MNEWPLVGHQNVKAFLGRVLRNNCLHHAYLFLGPARVGKMTAARIFAQTILCDQSQTGAPCGQCHSCRAFLQRSHPDFLFCQSEEGGAIGIETVRHLISDFKGSALLGRARLGIIDQAHNLTIEAQNALLKTLEEPKQQKILILISEQLLLPTIASRVQTIKFSLAKENELIEFLKQENLSRRQMHELIDLAGGRTGVLLDFLRHQEKIKKHGEEKQKFFSLLAENKLFNLFALEFLGKDLDGARERWRDFSEIGLRALRSLLLWKLGAGGRAQDCLTDSDKNLAEKYSVSKLASLINKIQILREQVKANVDPRFVLENFYLEVH